MALFPRLKTNAVAQFPSDKRIEYATEVLRFVDGTEQRFRQFGRTIQRWIIPLELLDEKELATVLAFHEAQAGRQGFFTFLDPWDGVEYDNCSFEDDTLTQSLDVRAHGQTKLTIRRNLS